MSESHTSGTETEVWKQRESQRERERERERHTHRERERERERETDRERCMCMPTLNITSSITVRDQDDAMIVADHMNTPSASACGITMSHRNVHPHVSIKWQR